MSRISRLPRRLLFDDVVQLQHRASIVHRAFEGNDVTIHVAHCEFYIRAADPHMKALALETIRNETRVPDKLSASVLVDFQLKVNGEISGAFRYERTRLCSSQVCCTEPTVDTASLL